MKSVASQLSQTTQQLEANYQAIKLKSNQIATGLNLVANAFEAISDANQAMDVNLMVSKLDDAIGQLGHASKLQSSCSCELEISRKLSECIVM